MRTLLGVESVTDSGVVRLVCPSDQPLWRRSLDGDGDAFGVLFDRYRDRVFRHACRLAQTRHDAEDLVAAAFLELWRRRGGVRLVDGSVLPWLLVTTTNLGRNAARGRLRYRQFLARLPRSQDMPDAADVALEGHVLGVDPRLRAALRSLNKTDAQLVALVALEDYPLAEAAEHLGMSVSAARSRLHRARTRMRGQLGAFTPVENPDEQGDT